MNLIEPLDPITKGIEDMDQSKLNLPGFGTENTRRMISGIFIVLLIVGGILSGGLLWFCATLIISVLSLWEYYQLISEKAHISRGLGLLASIALFLSAIKGLFYLYVGPVLAITAFFILLIEIVRRQYTGISNAIWNLSGILSGIIYVVLPWIFMFNLRTYPRGLYILLALFMCTWSCDVFAYIIGTRWGKKPLCENVSPKKTWEGFWGGLAGSLLGGVIVAYSLGFPPSLFILIGLICGIAGQFGDLGESILKREVGIKDSGEMIPGHGGVLDRFDSILISATLTYLIFGVIMS